MAHLQQQQFFEQLSKLYPDDFQNVAVVEVGSLDINGSIRSTFQKCAYRGYDLDLGPGVDFATQGQLISEPTGSVDTTVSSECFEHNPYWVETFANMLRLTKPGGLVIFTCASLGRQEHGTSRTAATDSPLTTAQGWDYYRNLTAEDFESRFFLRGWFSAYHFLYCPLSFDLYFYGRRAAATTGFDAQAFIRNAEILESILQTSSNTVRIGYWTQQTGWLPRLVWSAPNVLTC